MKFNIRVETTGLQKKFDLLVDQLEDLTEPLRAFGAYLRKKAKKKFEEQGPGWKAISESTQERLEHTRTHRITARGTVRKSARRSLKRTLEQNIRKGLAGSGARAELRQLFDRKRARSQDDLEKAFRSQLGRSSRDTHNATLTKLREDLDRFDRKTSAQRKRGGRKAARHKLLGRLASTLRATVGNNTLTVFSSVPWAGVHNKGGVAGHDSQIPQREFLALDEEDVGVLKTILEARMTEAFD